MTFFDDLRRELALRGIEPRRIRRIVLELEDHLACDSSAQLGDPAEIAARFAVQLRLARTRRATVGGLAALALTAAAVGSTSFAVSPAGGWPDLFGARGAIVGATGLMAAFAAQVSFVAGVLAGWSWLWRPDDLWLVQRRLAVAVAAAWLVAGADLVDAVVLQPRLPSWWFALAIAGTLASALALGAASRAIGRATALTPRTLRRPPAGWRPSRVAAVWLATVGAMTLGSALAERSWPEGLFRGVFELVAFGAGFATLGRTLGLRADRHGTAPTLSQ